MRLTAIDIFGGAGGLTGGLEAAGFEVVGAVDNSPLAIQAYRMNHDHVRTWRRDIRRLDPSSVAAELEIEPGELALLAGCPPCQGFSTIRTRRRSTNVEDRRNGLVAQFARWAEVLRPQALMMENVPGLADDIRLTRMMGRLKRLGYGLTTGVLDAADYGVPQRRKRFVLLALLDDEVAFAPSAATKRTVRDAIGHLAEPGDSDDPLHDHGEQRSEKVRARIAAIPPEGGLRQLDESYQLDCHRRTAGFYDVYGRMRWDEPAPTITGGCINPSKGRFLHPEQNRAITLREAALLQSFPGNYELPLDRGKYRAAELIGNALPPRFVQHHAAALAAALQGTRKRSQSALAA
jgi:DNA (cytosine-5)-methyltransferase 1